MGTLKDQKSGYGATKNINGNAKVINKNKIVAAGYSYILYHVRKVCTLPIDHHHHYVIRQSGPAPTYATHTRKEKRLLPQ